MSVPYGPSLAQLLVRKSWPGHVRSRSYEVRKGKGQSIFARNSGLLHIRTTAKLVVTIKIRTSLPDTTIMPFWSSQVKVKVKVRSRSRSKSRSCQ